MIRTVSRNTRTGPKNKEIRQVHARELSCENCTKTVIVSVSADPRYWPLHRCADRRAAPFTASAELQQVALWKEE